jgi:hypothetical protein
MFVRLMATLQARLKGLSQEIDLGYKKNNCKEIRHNRGEMIDCIRMFFSSLVFGGPEALF